MWSQLKKYNKTALWWHCSLILILLTILIQWSSSSSGPTMKVAKTFSLFPFLRTQQSWKRPPSLATVQRILLHHHCSSLICIVFLWRACDDRRDHKLSLNRPFWTFGVPALPEKSEVGIWLLCTIPRLAMLAMWQCWQTNERKYDDDNIRLPPLSFQWTVSLPLTIHHFCTFSFWKLFSCWGDFYLTLS